MQTLNMLVNRNLKIYFKDKGMFLVSLITPVILLVLYITFLGNVFREAFMSSMPSGIEIDKKLIEGLVGGQLVSSMLAVCPITISFCSNLVMIQDKFSNAIKDITIAPINRTMLALSYFIASFLASLIVCFITTILGLIYIAVVGWYLTAIDVLNILIDVIMLSLFGTCLSSIIHFFLSTQGQASAVGTIVSSLYGFVCGAYMPMSQFPQGLRDALSLLPGTYGTVLLRHHAMNSVINELPFPDFVLENIRFSIDSKIKCFGNVVEIPAIYGIIIGTIIGLLGIYILINVLTRNKKKKK